MSRASASSATSSATARSRRSPSAPPPMRRGRRVLRVAIAGIRAGSSLTVSAAVGLPAAVRRSLSDQGIAVFVETDEQWIERMVGRTDVVAEAADAASAPRPPREARRVRVSPSPRCTGARRGRRRRPRPRRLRQRGDDRRAARAAAVPARAVDHDHGAPLRQPGLAGRAVTASDSARRAERRARRRRVRGRHGLRCSSAGCRRALSTAPRTNDSTAKPTAVEMGQDEHGGGIHGPKCSLADPTARSPVSPL